MSDALRYPIGRFEFVDTAGTDVRASALEALAEFPKLFRRQAEALTEGQLATPYRPGGWTRRQVIHHVADSHINAYVRTHWLLTEEEATLKPYDEKRWAELPDATSAPIALSLDLLDALHRRWHALLAALPDTAFAQEIAHPVSGAMSLDRLVQTYAWHGRHHLGHLQVVANAG